MAHLDVLSQLDNPNAKIIIDLPETTVVGYLTQEISIGGSNQWSDGEDSQILGGLSKGVNIASGFANRFGAGAAQRQITNLSSTMASWGGSEKLTIDIPLVFVGVGSGPMEWTDVRIPVKYLYTTVYPQMGAGSANWGMEIKAPLGYVHNRASDIGGAIALQIGQWLKIPPIMISESVNFSFSKQSVVLEGGGYAPLYASGNITLKSARYVGAEEVVGFFV